MSLVPQRRLSPVTLLSCAHTTVTPFARNGPRALYLPRACQEAGLQDAACVHVTAATASRRVEVHDCLLCRHVRSHPPPTGDGPRDCNIPVGLYRFSRTCCTAVQTVFLTPVVNFPGVKNRVEELARRAWLRSACTTPLSPQVCVNTARARAMTGTKDSVY